MTLAHVNGVKPDLVTGRLKEGALQMQLSVRGDTIVIGYSNAVTMKGFEIAYSPQATRQFIELLLKAVEVAEGRGR